MGTPLAPTWLNEQAKDYYLKRRKHLANITVWQSDLLALLADQWETYHAARDELQEYANEHGTLTAPGHNGQPRPHPSLGTQDKALDNFLRIEKQLRSSIENKDEAEQLGNSLKDFIREARDE